MTTSTPTPRTSPATRTSPAIPPSSRGRRQPWRLRGGTRKFVLLAHIVAGGAWIGMDVVMGILVFTGMLTDDVGRESLTLRALEVFAVWPVLTAGLLSLITGVALGLGSKYGLVRYWWVAVKLALNVVLVVLVLFLLRGGVDQAAVIGRELALGQDVDPETTNLIFPPIVSTSALLLATVLSVYKPWGRLRPDRS